MIVGFPRIVAVFRVVDAANVGDAPHYSRVAQFAAPVFSMLDVSIEARLCYR